MSFELGGEGQTDPLERSSSRLRVDSVGTIVTCHHHTWRHCRRGILKRKFVSELRKLLRLPTANIYRVLSTHWAQFRSSGGPCRGHSSHESYQGPASVLQPGNLFGSLVVRHFTGRRIRNLLCSFKSYLTSKYLLNTQNASGTVLTQSKEYSPEQNRHELLPRGTYI